MTSNVDQRKSKPERKAPTEDPDENAAIEAENGLRQTKFVIDPLDRVCYRQCESSCVSGQEMNTHFYAATDDRVIHPK